MPRKAREVPAMGDALTSTEQAAVQEVAPKQRKTRTWKAKPARGERKADGRSRASAPNETRAQQSREAETGYDDWDQPWTQSGTLPYVAPREGMVQRWVRATTQVQPDATNWSRKWREGWRPRPADTLPKSFNAPTIAHGQHAGCVGVEGMILCEMPISRNDQRNAFFEARKNRQTSAVNEELAKASQHGARGFGPVMSASRTEVERRAVKSRDVPAMADDE